MKSKIKGRPTRIVSPFGDTVHKTERSAVAVLMHWMREIIEKRSLDLGLPDVDTSSDDRKQPDTVIYESRGSQKALCVIEAKPPYYDAFDEKELKEPARQKATHRKAKYFATTNFKKFIWFNTEKVNSMKPEEEQVLEKYNFSEIEILDEIEQSRYRDPIKKGLEDFLLRLYAVHTGKEPEPQLAIDDYLIFRLHEKIRILSKYYKTIIDDQCHKDAAFATKIKNWFIEQGWNFTWQPQDFDKAARQTAYLLVNKILFYDLLQAKRPQDFDKLDLSEGLTKGGLLKSTLQGYFNQVLKIDYETIYTTDFIDTIAFPEAKEVVEEIKDLVSILKRYDFSTIGYDIIGRIFERLIPQDERHNLGQYFTNPDIVDLILRFCLNHEEDKVLDPACGAGTFLVRAYKHKQMMNLRLKHENLLDTLWGDDIAKFPAHLSTINLAINDLGVEKNYPNIIQEDFFTILSPSDGGFELPEKWRKVRAKTLRIDDREVTFPRWFDAIVGNPPYTRQEEIREMGVDKGKLIENALRDPAGNKIVEIGRRAGIHAYFFIHGTKFLKDGGYFGFIVSNSWLDVDYGKGLQEFFLKNYKIVAIIESKVERWFEEADINTCIVILKKCKVKKERDDNLVRFVYLKKPLRYFISPAQDMWEKQVDRLNEIGKLKKTILAHNDFYENDELHIFPNVQKELWDEGFDQEKQKYVGAKWGKYLRAPAIFFKILKKGKSKLIPLKAVADVRRGFTTGADPWFYVHDLTKSTNTKEMLQIAARMGYKGKASTLKLIRSGDNTVWPIEKRYVHPVIRNPDNYRRVFIDVHSVEDSVVIIDEPRDKIKNQLIEKYIQHGERKNYKMGKDRSSTPAKTETCMSRKYWFCLPDIKPSRILWQKAFDISHRHYFASNDVFANQRFYQINLKRAEDEELIAAFLNSAIVSLYLEFQRTVMGLGAIEATVEEVKQLFIVNPATIKLQTKKQLASVLNEFGKREIGSVFEELGGTSAADITLNKVKPDRRELDKLIMVKILGLSENDQLEIYKAVIDLVKSRINRAKSVIPKKKTKEGIDIEAFVKTVMTQIGTETLGKFYRENIISSGQITTKTLPDLTRETRIDRDLLGWKLYSGKKCIECHSEHEAQYLKVFLEAGQDKIKVPKDSNNLRKILPELIELKKKIDAVIDSYLESIIDSKTREKLRRLLWQEIMK